MRWLTLGRVRPLAAILLALAGVWAIIHWLTPKAEYLPEGEESKIFTLMFAPPGYNIHMMRDAFQEVDRHFTPAVGRDPAEFARGEAEVPALNFTIGFANESRVFVVREATDRLQTADLMRVATEKTAELPGLRSFSTRGSIFSGNFGGTRSINIEISDVAIPAGGGNPVVQLTLTNDLTQGLKDLPAGDIRFTIAQLSPGANGGSSEWQSYVTRDSGGITDAQADAERGSAGTFTDNGDGTYTYTFASDLTAYAAGPTYDENLPHRLAVLSHAAIRQRTHHVLDPRQLATE